MSRIVALTKHKEDISKVVEELGPALTHNDVEIRLKAMKFLSDLLNGLPDDLLDENQLKFITAFYCDRMKDHHSIAPQVVIGLVKIVRMKYLPRSSPVEILRNLFANIPCQSQVRGDRANIFNLLAYLSDNFQDELKVMGADFLFGVIQAVEGERDPRNLVYLFDFMPRFLSIYPLFHFAEEMFEVFSCYFPVDFHPSPNDPDAISRDTLAEKLAKCLCASKRFAKDCIALALEKLDTDVKSAKVDSLKLLTEAVQRFDDDSLMENFPDVWEALKKELMQDSPHFEVRENALLVIKEFVVKFKKHEHNMEIILNQIFTTTIGTLLARDSKLYHHALGITLTCAAASDTSCAYVAGKVFPVYLTDLTSNEELAETEKIEILEDFKQLVQIVKNNNILSSYSNDNVVLSIQRELMKALMSHASAELMKITWQILSLMAPILTSENRLIVLKRLSDEMKVSTDEQDLCLQSLAKCYPKEVQQVVLDPYVNRTYEDDEEAKTVFKTLSHLISVAELQDQIFEVLCINLFNNPSNSIKKVVLQVLQDILKLPESQDVVMFLYDEWKIVVKLMDMMRDVDPNDSQDVMYQSTLLMQIVVEKLPNDIQMQLVEKYLPRMKLNESIADLYITSGILGFLDPAVPVEGHFEQLVNDLVNLSLTTSNDDVRRVSNQLICSLFNRAPIDDKHKKILRKIFEKLKDEIKDHKHHAVEILGWLSKGLLARGHPDAAEIFETLSEALDHPRLRYAAMLAFEIVSLEFPQLHLPLLRHLFRQKIFTLAMKYLDNKIEKFSEHHLAAMAHILRITPFVALRNEKERVGPILFRCIKSTDEPSNASRVLVSLNILNEFIKHKNHFIVDHLQHLVGDILQLTNFKSSMEVRISACKSIRMLTIFPLYTLVPYKQDVILGLTSALDDPKRLVRSAAVEARLAWYLLGEPKPSK